MVLRFMDYNGWGLHLTGVKDEVIRTTTELDYNFLTNAFSIVGDCLYINLWFVDVNRKEKNKPIKVL
ncbi:hypothetical protein Q9251_04395 [Alkalihalobacillus macyae]|uniref:hypothetical protein n=1 Tax=Guptibacillus hwajinpoensis TaxID=208199 RepID=UPI00273BC16D|nr:hypothetical protein [Alkalihalobacillus macyae]MDP4550119.1 hypothetical protein [Alkalihalobacillus macyae]